VIAVGKEQDSICTGDGGEICVVRKTQIAANPTVINSVDVLAASESRVPKGAIRINRCRNRGVTQEQIHQEDGTHRCPSQCQ
jgi:hypothetical protein